MPDLFYETEFHDETYPDHLTESTNMIFQMLQQRPDIMEDVCDQLHPDSFAWILDSALSCGRRGLLRQLWNAGLIDVGMWARRFHESPRQQAFLLGEIAFVLLEELAASDQAQRRRALKALAEIAGIAEDPFDYQHASLDEIQAHIQELFSPCEEVCSN